MLKQTAVRFAEISNKDWQCWFKTSLGLQISCFGDTIENVTKKLVEVDFR